MAEGWREMKTTIMLKEDKKYWDNMQTGCC